MILVIDDHPATLEGMANLLKRRGYDVITAEGGQRGLDVAAKHVPALVLCDFRMPDVDGIAVLHALRENPKTCRIPFVLISHSDPQSIRDRCTAHQVDAILQKRYAWRDLIPALERIFSNQASNTS